MASRTPWFRPLSSIWLLLLLCVVVSDYGFSASHRVKLMDLVNIKGVRANSLIGYGLVYGLAGTGDSAASLASKQAAANMLRRFGMNVKSDDIASGNFAAVIVTAELPAFSRSGDKLDLRISANGDATSLAGGTLLLTPLKAGDGLIYAVGQGAVVVGQAGGAGPSVLTVATVPQGASVEREFRPIWDREGQLTLSLSKPSFSTNAHVVKTINTHFRGFYAKSADPTTIIVDVPGNFRSRPVQFVAELERLAVDVETKAVVVLNERTGTVVMGSQVVIGPVTITHGNLSVEVKDEENEEETRQETVVNVGGTTVGEIVKSLNDLGVKPLDLIGILQAVHAAGALHGELRVM